MSSRRPKSTGAVARKGKRPHEEPKAAPDPNEPVSKKPNKAPEVEEGTLAREF